MIKSKSTFFVAIVFSYLFGFMFATHLFEEKQKERSITITQCVKQECGDTQKIKDMRKQLEACVNDLAALSYEQNADIVCMDEYVCELKRKD
jgi:hypothetical protein